MEQIVNNTVSTPNFSASYPILNKYLMESGSSVPSRNGGTKEILNFKTELTNPYLRCVGGFGRDMNIFFLLAEAFWIFSGRKDVAFLKIFNERMGDYSDDGKSFHAPYGFRLRHYGINSFDTLTEENKHSGQGLDQIEKAVKMLSNNPDDRRVVLSIWNPDLDLATTSLDLPCNDLLMFKIRNGQLHTTISNRSNDLHWGLPTNIFQFGTVSELLALTLGVELGTQVHNSQSLHYYLENQIAWKLYENYQMLANDKDKIEGDLYNVCGSKPFIKMDYNFDKIGNVDLTPNNKLSQLDSIINQMIDRSTEPFNIDFAKALGEKSIYFLTTYTLLTIYVEYKQKTPSDSARLAALDKVIMLGDLIKRPKCDLIVMAQNFFLSRVKIKPDMIMTFDKRIGKL